MTMVITTVNGTQLRVWSDNVDEQTYTCAIGGINTPIDVESDIFTEIPYHMVVGRGDHTDIPTSQPS